jgi:hypothetical protein
MKMLMIAIVLIVMAILSIAADAVIDWVRGGKNG